MAPFRIAVLECDSPPYPDFLANYGSLTQVFRLLFSRALPLLAAPTPYSSVVLTRHHIVYPRDPTARLPEDDSSPESTYPDLDAVDALLISGSQYDAMADAPWVLRLVEFVGKAVASGKVRIMGVCFGHQILARALGSEVRVAPGGREAAVDIVELNDEGKRVFGLEKMVSRESFIVNRPTSPSSNQTQPQRIQHMHRDEVASLPEGAILLGYSAKCPIQAYYKPGHYIAVQGHPEIPSDIMREFLTVRYSLGRFTKEFYTEAMTRADLENDGVHIGKVFLEFAMQ